MTLFLFRVFVDIVGVALRCVALVFIIPVVIVAVIINSVIDERRRKISRVH